jgi:hypothetical protein
VRARCRLILSGRVGCGWEAPVPHTLSCHETEGCDVVPGGLQVSPMLDAVVSFPRCKGFFAAVLHLMASMPADDSSGLVEEEDIELLVAMLDEYKMPSVIERACMAICNIAGQNSALSERVGAEGGVTMLLGWLVDEEILAQPDTIAAICLAIGLLADAVSVAMAPPPPSSLQRQQAAGRGVGRVPECLPVAGGLTAAVRCVPGSRPTRGSCTRATAQPSCSR